MDDLLDAERIQSEGMAIRILGQFNPAIFHPAWFARHNLVSNSAADKARVEVVHSAIARFQLDWSASTTTSSEWALESEDPGSYERVRDLAVGGLRALPETPLSGLLLSTWWHVRQGAHIEREPELATAVVAPGLINVLGDARLQALTLELDPATDAVDEMAISLEPSRKFEKSYFIQVFQRMQRVDTGADSISRFLLDDWWVAHRERQSVANTIVKQLDEVLS